MEIQLYSQFEHTSIQLIGKLCTLNDYQKLRNTFTNINVDKSYVVIDLSRLVFTSTHGIGEILTFSKSLKKNNKELLLYNPIDEIKSLLTLIGINQVIHIISSQDDLYNTLNNTETCS